MAWPISLIRKFGDFQASLTVVDCGTLWLMVLVMAVQNSWCFRVATVSWNWCLHMLHMLLWGVMVAVVLPGAFLAANPMWSLSMPPPVPVRRCLTHHLGVDSVRNQWITFLERGMTSCWGKNIRYPSKPDVMTFDLTLLELRLQFCSGCEAVRATKAARHTDGLPASNSSTGQRKGA